DIFSLGSVLYELLTGHQAFQGGSKASVLASILRDDPAPVAGASGGVPVEMENIVGRCLRKDLERRFQSAADLRVVLQELADQKLARTTSPQPPVRRRTWLWAAPLAAAIALALLVAAPPVRQRIAAWFFSRVPAQKQIAVLPFQNVGGDPANQAFCDGLAETLTSALSQLEQFQGALWVVPASEVRREAIAGVRAAQQAFGVNLVITGSVQRVGDRLRLTANLVDARTVRQLGARSMDTTFADITTLQDGVVAEVADLLEVELQPQARSLLAAGNTSVSNAYNLYLQGRGHLQAGKLEDAIADFGKAAQQDPAYALAYAGLGEASLGQYRLTRDRKWLEDARQASAKAVALNDRLPSAHVNLGVIQTVAGHHEEAIRELRRALELNAVHTDALRELATAYAAARRLEEAESTYRKAIQLRPSYWLGYRDLGLFYYQHGRYAEAETPFRKVVELIPDHYVGYRNLGGLYHLMGRYPEAEQMFQKSLAIRPTNFAYLNLGTTYFFQGRYRDAVAMNEKALQLGVADYVVWGNLADAYRWTPEFAAKAPDTYRRAIQEAEKELAINPDNAIVISSLGVYWARLGDKEKALAELEQARRLAPKNGQVAFKSAIVYELAGSRSLALAALEAALRGGYSVTEIRGEPDLATLRKDPRCERLLAGAFLRR
ncbi:MAG: tetratricopeptide repeat protein, partial [Acidobacteria bacterium]|nr:tetratricopeptide repeat protein [Acidobacteriota bacterium]